jgi:ER lumen protein retaining receptor
MWSGIRTFADLMHLASFIIIIYHLFTSRNCKGVSLKTQEIYLIVFSCRYMDLFMYFINLYNTTMKLAFLVSTILIIYLMRLKKPICEVRKIYK